jgi:hypothetical protein
MRKQIEIERKARLERLLTKIESSRTPSNLKNKWLSNLLELYLGYCRARDESWPNSNLNISKVFADNKNLVLHMYVHEPVSVRVQKILDIYDSGDHMTARAALEKLRSKEEGVKIKSEIQTIHRSNAYKPKEFEQLLDDIFKKNPAIREKEMLNELSKQVGKGIINHFEDDNNLIKLKDGREFAISGLKDQIYKRRKNL